MNRRLDPVYVVRSGSGRPVITNFPTEEQDILFTARDWEEAREWCVEYQHFCAHRRAFRWAIVLVLALAAVFMTGCSSVPRAEFAWQALHAVDVAQTVQIARSECYREADELTKRIIGEDPTVAGAVAWGVGVAALHYGVSRWLQAIDSPRWVQASWQVLTIANTGHAVKNNFDQGIDPWGTDC